MKWPGKDRSMSFFELREALSQPGCPVCRLKTESADRFLDTLLWESVNDPERREDIRRARGFCYEHSWALVRASGSLGIAIITRDILQTLFRTFDKQAFGATAPFSWRRVQETLNADLPSAATADLVAQLEPQAPCSACVWADKMEQIYLDTLIHGLVNEEGMLDEYKASSGLCLPHFRQALARVRKRATYEALLEGQRVIWERLIDHLSESIRKSDYRRLGETWGEEAGAWRRAIAALVGTRPKLEKKR